MSSVTRAATALVCVSVCVLTSDVLHTLVVCRRGETRGARGVAGVRHWTPHANAHRRLRARNHCACPPLSLHKQNSFIGSLHDKNAGIRITRNGKKGREVRAVLFTRDWCPSGRSGSLACYPTSHRDLSSLLRVFARGEWPRSMRALNCQRGHYFKPHLHWMRTDRTRTTRCSIKIRQ